MSFLFYFVQTTLKIYENPTKRNEAGPIRTNIFTLILDISHLFRIIRREQFIRFQNTMSNVSLLRIHCYRERQLLRRKKWEFYCFAFTYSVISRTSFAIVRYIGLHIVPITKFHVDVGVNRRF